MSSWQEGVALGLVVLSAAYWAQRLGRGVWVEPVSRWLLRRGHVALAMRLRFGKRRR